VTFADAIREGATNGGRDVMMRPREETRSAVGSPEQWTAVQSQCRLPVDLQTHEEA
jgi:hypothetical protein